MNTSLLNPRLNLETGSLSIAIPGDILSTNADSLREDLFGVLESEPMQSAGWKTLELDLTQARMIDSVGLNLIVSVVRMVKARQGAVVANVRSSNIYRTFTFTRLDKQMTVIRAEAPAPADELMLIPSLAR
ncbi:MAG: STAS domain-containing protein [Verrucomicrobiota bacterium]